MDERNAKTRFLPKPDERRPAGSSAQTTIEFGAVSHKGKVRENNEDSFLVSKVERRLTALMSNLPAGQIEEQHGEAGYGMLVADGMGGAAAGEIASRTAVSALRELAINTPDWIMRLDEEGSTRVLERMEQRFAELTKILTRLAKANPSLSGMGTTLTLAVSLGPELILAHVGDSRVYLYTLGRLVRLTRDQTMGQLLADLGVISSTDVPTHSSRHVLTGAISAGGEKAPVEMHHLQLTDGDQLLLCSDGLTEMVMDNAIAAVLKENKTPAETCDTLLNLALAAGGKDNITIIVARYSIPETK
jgi:protein phosphatase